MENISILRQVVLFVFILLIISSCTANEQTIPTVEKETILQTVEVTRIIEVTRIVELPVTLTPSFTPEYTPTITPLPTITPTFAFPEGEVLEQANCRYGPGAAYLYKYGLYPGYQVEIQGRNQLGTWAYVLALGFPDRCWVKTSLLEITGDIYSVPPYHALLPYTEFYGPPQNVSARRENDVVIVSWDPVWMSEDDYRGYLIEAWLCQDGQLIFTPLRFDETVANLRDEPGCTEPSSAKIYTAEKHGYTQYVPIPWPPHDQTPDSSP